MDSSNKCKCGKPADRKISLEPELGFIYVCSNECRDKIISEIEQNAKVLSEIDENREYRQGKSRENYEASSKVVAVSGIILVLGLLIYLISYIITLISNS